MKTLFLIIFGALVMLGAQTLRAMYIQDQFVEGVGCKTEWKDEVDWDTENWSFTKTYWTCPTESLNYE